MNTKMRKPIAVALALVMMLMLLSACGSNEEPVPATDAATEAPVATETAATTAATEAQSTETTTPEEPTEKTVISVEVYEDCDGSGHGVKIITYSDGTQEEEAF